MHAPVFAGSALHLAGGALFTLLLAAACASDLRSRRIPNAIAVALAVGGVAFAVGTQPSPRAALVAIATLAGALALWLPLYALRMIGAGDVKLVAAASAWLGPAVAVEGTLWALMLGGAFALVWTLVDRGPALGVIRLYHLAQQPTILRDGPLEFRRRLPYAIPIAAGLLTAALLPGRIL